MNKEIYFCVDIESYYTQIQSHRGAVGYLDYKQCKHGVNVGISPIVTYQLAILSFDLLEEGYDIYLCYKDKKVKIEPHMDLNGTGEPCKDLRFGHNIFKMFRAGIFNELLGIKKGE